MKIKVTKKPIPVTAIEYNGDNFDEIKDFCGDAVYQPAGGKDILYVKTFEGTMKCKKGNYIIQGIDGEFYPIKKEIFEKTYDIVGYWQ